MNASEAYTGHPRRCFSHRLDDDSAKCIGILCGDTLIIERDEPKQDDIVLVEIEGTDTLLRYRCEGAEPRFEALCAEGETPGLYYPAENTLLTLNGIARACVRNL